MEQVMGRALLKPKKDENFYVEWSSIVEAPVKWGTRRMFTSDWNERELARVDEHGTSTGWYDGWDDPDPGLMYEQRGRVKLEDLKDLVFAIVKKDDLTPFITPFEEDD
jgi:hypothetical protein